jgi:hypothetical protein
MRKGFVLLLINGKLLFNYKNSKRPDDDFWLSWFWETEEVKIEGQ